MNDSHRLPTYFVGIVLLLASCKATPGGPQGPLVESDVADAGELNPLYPASCQHVEVKPDCHDDYCLIPSGCFARGSPETEFERGRYTENEKEVTLTHPLLMQQHETTQAEWMGMGFANLAGTVKSSDGSDCLEPSCPASTMTFFEAVAFANALSDKHGLQHCIELEGCSGTIGVDFRCLGSHQTTDSYYDCTGFRFPTGAEFEYALRAGTRTTFYSGDFSPLSTECVGIDHLDKTAWYCNNSDKITHPVMRKTPNPWGLFDMMGNVSELVVSDPMEPTVGEDSETDPGARIPTSNIVAWRGGPYFGWPTLMRSANNGTPVFVLTEGHDQRDAKGSPMGFRLVRTLTPEQAAAW